MSKSISIPRSNGKTVNLSILQETPNGTIYGVTPGGTKLIYKRDQMLSLKNSPAAQTPPRIPNIPGVNISTSEVSTTKSAEVRDNEDHRPNPEHDDDTNQFDMDA